MDMTVYQTEGLLLFVGAGALICGNWLLGVPLLLLGALVTGFIYKNRGH